MNRRQFIGSLFRAVATAATLAYAPTLLLKPKPKPFTTDTRQIIKDYQRAMERFKAFTNTEGDPFFEDGPIRIEINGVPAEPEDLDDPKPGVWTWHYESESGVIEP